MPRRRGGGLGLHDWGEEYPYSEVVFPWVRGRIELGDRNRQLGQDLLFCTEPKMWARRRDCSRRCARLRRRPAPMVRKGGSGPGHGDKVFAIALLCPVASRISRFAATNGGGPAD